AASVEHTRRLELDQPVGELPDGRTRVERLDVQADVDRSVEVDEAAQPVGEDVARVIDQSEHTQRAAFHGQVRAADLDVGRGDQVGDRSRTTLEPLLRWRRWLAMLPPS